MFSRDPQGSVLCKAPGLPTRGIEYENDYENEHDENAI
jgi:hypothetical protein